MTPRAVERRRLSRITGDTYALSMFGKLLVSGSLLAGVLLTTIAAIKGSKWWLVFAGAGVITLVDFFIRLEQLKQLDRY